MKISTLLLCILSCLLVANVTAKKQKAPTKTPEQVGEAKLKMMYDLEAKASDSVIMFNPSQYKELV
jgi:hypothetical protein